MNYYKHYIGDFQRDTSHLSLTERGAYLALIHHYYATEKPLPNNHAALCRIAGAMSKQERDAVLVAMGFFEPMESGLVHTRIEAEIDKAGKRSDTNRDIALAREAARKALRTEHDKSTNRATNRGTSGSTKTAPYQTPDTINQTPKEQEPGAAAPVFATDADFEVLWKAFDGRYGEKGSKKLAAAAFKKLKPDKALFETMVAAVHAQTANRDQAAVVGVFRAYFKHVERWIRNQEWTNEIIPVNPLGERPVGGSLPGEPRRESTVDRNSRKARERIAEIDAELAGFGESPADAVDAHG